MATFMTNRGMFLLAKGDLDFDTADIRVALSKIEVATATGRDYNFLSDWTPGTNEVTATNYVRKTLASVTVTEDDTNDRVDVDYANVTWTALGGASNDTINHAVVYKEGASDAAREIIAFVDSANFPLTTNGSDVTLTITNLFRLTSAAV